MQTLLAWDVEVISEINAGSNRQHFIKSKREPQPYHSTACFNNTSTQGNQPDSSSVFVRVQLRLRVFRWAAAGGGSILPVPQLRVPCHGGF